MIHDVLNQREKLYGDFATLAPIAQTLKRILRSTPSAPFSDIQTEALENIAVKLARILNGDPNVADNWQDIAGYASLAHEELVLAAQPKSEPVKAPVVRDIVPPVPYGKTDAAAKAVLQSLTDDPPPAFLSNGKKDKSL